MGDACLVLTMGYNTISLFGGRHAHFPLSATGPPSARGNHHPGNASTAPARLLPALLGEPVAVLLGAGRRRTDRPVRRGRPEGSQPLARNPAPRLADDSARLPRTAPATAALAACLAAPRLPPAPPTALSFGHRPARGA